MKALRWLGRHWLEILILSFVVVPVLFTGWVDFNTGRKNARSPRALAEKRLITSPDGTRPPSLASALLPAGLAWGDAFGSSGSWGLEKNRVFDDLPDSIIDFAPGVAMRHFIYAPGFEPVEVPAEQQSPVVLQPTTRSSLMATGPVTDASAHPLDLKPEQLRLWVRTPSGTFVPLPWGWGVTFSGGYVSTTVLLVGDIFSIEARHPVHGQGLLNPVELLPNEHNFLPPLVLAPAHRLVIRGGLAKPAAP